MKHALRFLVMLLLAGVLAGCGEEEGANAGKIPAPKPPEDLQKLFQRPDKKGGPSKKAELSPAVPGAEPAAATGVVVA